MKDYIFAFLIVLGMVLLLDHAINIDTKNDCNKYLEWSKQYDTFYITPSLRAQCDAMGVFIDPPVKSE